MYFLLDILFERADQKQARDFTIALYPIFLYQVFFLRGTCSCRRNETNISYCPDPDLKINY